MVYTLPVDLVPALGGALWPVTFVVLQMVTNVYFQRAGFWLILPRGDVIRGAIGRAGPCGGPIFTGRRNFTRPA
jgi:hypothetical protein